MTEDAAKKGRRWVRPWISYVQIQVASFAVTELWRPKGIFFVIHLTVKPEFGLNSFGGNI